MYLKVIGEFLSRRATGGVALLEPAVAKDPGAHWGHAGCTVSTELLLSLHVLESEDCAVRTVLCSVSSLLQTRTKHEDRGGMEWLLFPPVNTSPLVSAFPLPHRGLA